MVEIKDKNAGKGGKPKDFRVRVLRTVDDSNAVEQDPEERGATSTQAKESNKKKTHRARRKKSKKPKVNDLLFQALNQALEKMRLDMDSKDEEEEEEEKEEED